MARGGIYKSEVVRARDRLLAQGRHPSLDAIRIELGNTGSKSTIQKFLKEIEEEEAGKSGGKVALSEAIQDLVLRLAERLQDEADERIAELNSQHAQQLQAAQEVARAAQDEAAGLRRALETSRSETAAEKARYQELSTEYLATTQARAQAEQRAADLHLQLEAEARHRASIEGKYADARSSLEHFREAAKEQREREARQHENQVQFLQQEIHTLKQQVTEHQAKYVQANQELAGLTSELGGARRQLRDAERAAAQLFQATAELAGARVEVDGLKGRIAAEQRDAAAAREELAQARAQQRELEARVKELEGELITSRARNDSAQQLQDRLQSMIAGFQSPDFADKVAAAFERTGVLKTKPKAGESL